MKDDLLYGTFARTSVGDKEEKMKVVIKGRGERERENLPQSH